MGIDEILIDLCRVFDSSQNRFLRDFVECHAVDRDVELVKFGSDVKCNRFAFAVRVRCQIDGFRFLGGVFKLLNDRSLALNDSILWLEAVLQINTQFRLGQINDMTHRSLNRKILAQKFGKSFRFGWRLDYDQIFCHLTMLPRFCKQT